MVDVAALAPKQGVEEEKDIVGGNSFIVDTGVDLYTIELAYLSESDGGAIALNLHLKSSKALLRPVLWLTSGKEKGQSTTYKTKDGQEHYMQGYLVGNGIARILTEKNLFELTQETKTVKLWNYDLKADVPTEVDALTDLMGQKIGLAVQKQIVDKNVQNDQGQWVPSGETREQNEIIKPFHPETGKTTTEIRTGAEATFIHAWKEKWTGKVNDKSSVKKDDAGTAGAPPAAAQAAPAAEAKPLFD